MTTKERLDKANQSSVALYLRRQEIESQRQQLNAQAQQCEMELVRLDGDIRTLTAIIAEEVKPTDGE